MQSTSSVIFNEGKAQLYLLPNTQAGEELISILIPGLPPETIKIHLTA
ncbi:MAG: hypothetical protein Q4B28_03865 [bacterium]|nr:hypothetical protein [bacterium]